MSLNIPSSLEVKPPPHSCFSFDSMLFSASTLADFPTSSRFARSYNFTVPKRQHKTTMHSLYISSARNECTMGRWHAQIDKILYWQFTLIIIWKISFWFVLLVK
jgi:hypothetical protein